MPKPQKPAVQIINGRLFSVYFQSLYDEGDLEDKQRTTSCVVIAADATEAMAKANAAFPRERVTAIHEDRNYRGCNKQSPERIVL